MTQPIVRIPAKMLAEGRQVTLNTSTQDASTLTIVLVGESPGPEPLSSREKRFNQIIVIAGLALYAALVILSYFGLLPLWWLT